MTKTAKRNTVVSAILAIMLCISLMAGATFALFTSESPVNIAVKSGKVSVLAVISDLKAYSPTTIAQDSDNIITNADNAAINSGDTHQFANGGTVSVEDNEIKIANITPGDKVTFKITITNYSNVKAKYRTTVQKGNDDGLYAGLKFNIGGLYVESSTLWTDLAAVTDTENGEVVAEYTCTVELPANAGNTYKDKSCSIAYNVEAVQGNAETVNDSESSNITTEATETVTITTDENNNKVVAQEVSIVSKDSIAVSENQTVSAAKATVPANVKLDESSTDSLTLSVKETNVPSNITVVDTATRDAKNFDINISGVAEDNEEPITVSVYVGKGLRNVVVYHTHGDNTTEMTGAIYDATTGILTITTANFSDFTIVYDAITKVSSEAELAKALEDGSKCIKLTSDIVIVPVIPDTTSSSLTPQITVSKDTVLDLSDKKIGVNSDENFGTASPVLISVTSGTLTIDGNGSIDCEAGNQQVYGINVYGGNVVINGGNYYGAITAVQVQKGSLEINGGFFDLAPTCKAAVPQYAKYVVNCINANYKDGSAKISIKGGTFVNFDPSNTPEGSGTSYVANGYTVISETQTNGDIWYTVVPGTSVSTLDELADALASGKDVVLKNDINLSENTPLAITKSVTIYGNGNKLIWNGTQDAGRVINIQSENAGDLKDITLTLSGVDIVGPTDNSYNRGISAWGVENLTIIMDNCSASANHYALNIAAKNTNVNVVVRNTTLTGYSAFQTWSVGTNATFENCTLIGLNQWGVGSNDYATIVVCADAYDAAKDCTLTFKNCRIEANTSATATAPANERFLRVDTTGASVTFEGCTFFENGTEVTGDAIKDNMKTQTDTVLTIK